ncbi:uncharacterized protein [Drosophila takahashii]|uniref:uncharacterized protein isoform X4 n=1 Tax=Drosophila takahashii TaxID=29030 RepID=UPI003898FFC2
MREIAVLQLLPSAAVCGGVRELWARKPTQTVNASEATCPSPLEVGGRTVRRLEQTV